MPTNLTPLQMKQFVRDHCDEFVNKRNAAVIRRNLTPDFYDHDGPGGKPAGIDGEEQMMVAMRQNMPDLHITVEEMIAEGDKVVCRNIWRGPTQRRARRCSFAVSCYGGLKATTSPNAGQRCDATRRGISVDG